MVLKVPKHADRTKREFMLCVGRCTLFLTARNGLAIAISANQPRKIAWTSVPLPVPRHRTRDALWFQASEYRSTIADQMSYK